MIKIEAAPPSVIAMAKEAKMKLFIPAAILAFTVGLTDSSATADTNFVCQLQQAEQTAGRLFIQEHEKLWENPEFFAWMTSGREGDLSPEVQRDRANLDEILLIVRILNEILFPVTGELGA